MIRQALFLAACLTLNPLFIANAKAEEIVVVVSGNGSGSSSEVSVQSQNTTTVTQENNASINNSVTQNVNTGNNNANSNASGDTTILTGDVSSSTTISNQNINTNNASTQCNCSSSQKTTISGNGAESQNSTYITNNNSVVVGQVNNAVITNNIKTTANTGYNSASFNGGPSTIITGNIRTNNNIKNNFINNSVHVGAVAGESSSVVIVGNGVESLNNASLNNSSIVEVDVNNTAFIVNNIEEYLNTGGNSTLSNLGDNVIITGDIDSNTSIDNSHINSSIVEVDCGCKTPTKPTEPEKPTPTNNPPTGTSIVQSATGTSSGGNNPSGVSLPKTGYSIPLTWVFTLIFIFTFLTGLYLRFHSSKAPPSLV